MLETKEIVSQRLMGELHQKLAASIRMVSNEAAFRLGT